MRLLFYNVAMIPLFGKPERKHKKYGSGRQQSWGIAVYAKA